MVQLVKKYTILILGSIILAAFLAGLILAIFPDLLTTETAEGVRHTIGTLFLNRSIQYLFNIVLIILLSRDMKKANIQSIPILVLTFFHSTIGVLFFFLIMASKVLNLKKLIYNE